MARPFDDILIETMQETSKRLCEEIQCCKLAYTQSDEISLLLVDYETPETETWVNNNILKMASLSASMATLYFNTIFKEKVEIKLVELETETNSDYISNEEIEKFRKTYLKKINREVLVL